MLKRKKTTPIRRISPFLEHSFAAAGAQAAQHSHQTDRSFFFSLSFSFLTTVTSNSQCILEYIPLDLARQVALFQKLWLPAVELGLEILKPTGQRA